MPLKISHRKVGDVVEIPHEEFEQLEATLELLENDEVQKGILKSLREYSAGRSRSWREVRGEL